MGGHKVIRVFEYERLVIGKDYPILGGGEVIFTQKMFDALARFLEQSKKAFFELQHRAIRFVQFVGVIQLGTLCIEVLPKVDKQDRNPTEYTPWRNALLHMLAITQYRDRGSLFSTLANLSLQRKSLFGIHIEQFLHEVETILHHGQVRFYRSAQGNERFFRGRLMLTEHLRHNIAHKERFFLEHTVYDTDHTLHQILHCALGIVSTSSMSPHQEKRARQLQACFSVTPRTQWSQSDFQHLTLTRQSKSYQQAIQLAKLIILGHCPDIRYGQHSILALLFDMNNLFESFVSTLVKQMSVGRQDIDVHSQSTRRFWPQSGVRSRFLKPDLVIYRKGLKPRIVDIKWKNPKNETPDISDLRQMFAYNESFDADQSVLVYPRASKSQSSSQPKFFVGKEHACSTMFLDLFDESDQFSTSLIKQRLNSLISDEE